MHSGTKLSAASELASKQVSGGLSAAHTCQAHGCVHTADNALRCSAGTPTTSPVPLHTLGQIPGQHLLKVALEGWGEEGGGSSCLFCKELGPQCFLLLIDAMRRVASPNCSAIIDTTNQVRGRPSVVLDAKAKC